MRHSRTRRRQRKLSSIVGLDLRVPALVSALCLLATVFLIVPQSTHAQNAPASRQSDDPTLRTGIDPTDIRTRIETAYTYNDRSNDVTRHSFDIRLDRAFIKYGMNIRLDLPIIYADIAHGSSQGGLGNIGITFNYRYKKTPGHSALVGGAVKINTATQEALGDGTTKLTGVWVNSWRQRPWLLSIVTLATWSESGEYDAVGGIPLIGYQPMKKYLSYATLGFPVTQNLDDNETATTAIIRFGKVFKGGSVVNLGTRVDLSGNSDDKLVITIGYRRML
jgi:hypothetical protein